MVNTGMTTPWTFPTQVEQYAEDQSHVGWNAVDDFATLRAPVLGGVVAVAPLLHIARSPKYDVKMKTWYLRCTGFDFVNLPETVAGITLRLTMNRGGRVTDETVNLCYQAADIGKNQAQLGLDPVTIYGGPNNTWHTDSISIETVQDSSFGILLRFQSHPHWPHKTTPIVNAVELQIS
jgi:hypothetical protein